MSNSFGKVLATSPFSYTLVNLMVKIQTIQGSDIVIITFIKDTSRSITLHINIPQ